MNKKRIILIALSAVVAVMAGVIFWYWTKQSKNNEIATINEIQTESPDTKNNIGKEAEEEETPVANTDDSPKLSSDGYGAHSGDIQKPYGTFVSNHRPSISGKYGVPSNVSSICQGTPGATCTIVFKNKDSTKQLPEKILDSNGATDWIWDVKDAGLSKGSWTITAISKMGNKTASAQDSLNLEVQP